MEFRGILPPSHSIFRVTPIAYSSCGYEATHAKPKSNSINPIRNAIF